MDAHEDLRLKLGNKYWESNTSIRMNKHKILVSVRILRRVLKEKDIIVEGKQTKRLETNV